MPSEALGGGGGGWKGGLPGRSQPDPEINVVLRIGGRRGERGFPILTKRVEGGGGFLSSQGLDFCR